MSLREFPECKAFIICDFISIDPNTGKHYIMGTFEQIGCASLPTVRQHISVYLALSGGSGPYKTFFSLNSPQGAVIFEHSNKINLGSDKRKTHEFSYNLKGVKFESAGSYEFSLTLENNSESEIIVNRSFQVAQMPSGQV